MEPNKPAAEAGKPSKALSVFDEATQAATVVKDASSQNPASSEPIPAPAPAPVHTAENPPAQIGQYQVIELIGNGAMGVVYKAMHTVLKRKVALKIMREDLAKNPDFVSRFLREARLAATVESSHVVTVYDAANDNGLLYIALRYVSGGELTDLVKMNGGRLGEETALRVIRDCALGLQDIHNAGLVHRDLKPSNILLEKDGSARIADLGLARAVEQNESLTLAGQAMGTPSYMSPEQVKGAADIDIRSDIYSLGVTLFAILSGKLPYSGSSMFETMAKILYEPPPDPRQFVAGIRPEIVAVIMKSMEKNRGDRYQSPAELAKAIETVQRNSGLIPIPATMPKPESSVPAVPTVAPATAATAKPASQPKAGGLLGNLGGLFAHKPAGTPAPTPKPNESQADDAHPDQPKKKVKMFRGQRVEED